MDVSVLFCEDKEGPCVGVVIHLMSLPFVWVIVRFQVLTAASTKVTVFWDVAPCSLVENDRRFRGDRPDDGGSKHI
jgi:hypothetical protein